MWFFFHLIFARHGKRHHNIISDEPALLGAHSFALSLHVSLSFRLQIAFLTYDWASIEVSHMYRSLIHMLSQNSKKKKLAVFTRGNFLFDQPSA